MRPLRFAMWWALGGVALLAYVVYLCLEPPDGGGTSLINDKLAHFLAFFGLTGWFAALVQRRLYVAVALAMLALGGFIEVAQTAMALGRVGDWFDFWADSAGVAAAIVVSLAIRESWFERIERWLVPT